MDEDHTKAVQIVIWFTVITCILIVITKVIIKVTTIRSLKLDDYLVSAALVREPADNFRLSRALTYHHDPALRHRADSCGVNADLSWVRQTTEDFKPGRSRNKS